MLLLRGMYVQTESVDQYKLEVDVPDGSITKIETTFFNTATSTMQIPAPSNSSGNLSSKFDDQILR